MAILGPTPVSLVVAQAAARSPLCPACFAIWFSKFLSSKFFFNLNWPQWFTNKTVEQGLGEGEFWCWYSYHTELKIILEMSSDRTPPSYHDIYRCTYFWANTQLVWDSILSHHLRNLRISTIPCFLVYLNYSSQLDPSCQCLNMTT